MAYEKRKKALAMRCKDETFIKGKRKEHASAEKPVHEEIGTPKGHASRFNKAPARAARSSGDERKDVY